MRRYIFDVGISVLVWTLTGDVHEQCADALNKNQLRRVACRIKNTKKSLLKHYSFLCKISTPGRIIGETLDPFSSPSAKLNRSLMLLGNADSGIGSNPNDA
jgi:hypothetical protein